MSFIIGIIIGYSCIELIQYKEELQENSFLYNQNIFNEKNNSIKNFIEFENRKALENVKNKNIEAITLKKENYDVNINEISNKNKYDKQDWKIRIPKIGVEATIENGTSKEILNEFVGHFEETNKLYGNIGLAAHNRGYNVNYFEKIKYLENGDEIYYYYSGIETIYIVTSKNIIEDTNWKVLENTKDNRITLITCVENKPKYRLCVQGIEEKYTKRR